MPTNEELYRQAREIIENFPPYPDIDSLIASGHLAKVRGGYNVLSEVGMEAINKYIIAITAPNNGKPTIFQLSRRHKNSKTSGKQP